MRGRMRWVRRSRSSERGLFMEMRGTRIYPTGVGRRIVIRRYRIYGLGYML